MSCKSTYGIQRDIAIQVIMSSVYRASDEALELMLEALPESEFRNYNINGNGWSGEEDTRISTVAEFYEK